ncbi:hypothetical protein [Agromyces sp. Soil535]|uniref:hypothetical protein n=1 Tax=Agromyces sp. Soil535 TaxID=1736390 RepID=UPI000AA76CD5|nr:hypothetical protein [Agromyces sp. Soil535]
MLTSRRLAIPLDALGEQLDQIQNTLPSSPSVTDIIGAITGVVTAVVAIAALTYASIQVREAKAARDQARRLEVERAQPYVVLYTEASAATPFIIDLVVKNFGQTAARDVVLHLEPLPQRSPNPDGSSGIENLMLPAEIPTLAPGQEWRTMWDSTVWRRESGLPDLHSGMVTFTGIEGESLQSEVVLDWSLYASRRWVEVRGVHDAAVALREMKALMKKWTEATGGPLSVLVRDGDAWDAKKLAQFRDWQAATADEDNGS